MCRAPLCSSAVHLYNRTPVRHLAWRTPFKVLNQRKPDILHLRVFGCGAYVFIPEDIRQNKLTPRAEVMTFLGYTSGVKGFKFMRKPNNVIFQAVTVLFDEFMFPNCPDNKSPGHTRIGREYPSEDNIPPENGGGFDGGAYPPNMLYVPAGNVPPQGLQGPLIPPVPPVPQQLLQQPPNQPPWHAQWPAWQRQLWLDNWYENGYPSRPTSIDDPLLHPRYRGPVPRTINHGWQLGQQPSLPASPPRQTQPLPQGGNNQGNIPYQQPQAMPLVLLEAGPSGSTAPRRSGRTRHQPAPRPGDVYGNRTPMERQQMNLRTRLPNNEDIPVQSSLENDPIATDPPTPTSSGFNTPDTEPTVRLLRYQDPELTLSSLVQEEGAPLINF